AAAAPRAADVSRRAVESTGAVRAPMGVRRPATRTAPSRLPIQNGRGGAGVRGRRVAEIKESCRAVRHDARIGSGVKNRRVWLLLVWVIATAVLVAAARRVNWTHALAVTAGAKPGWIALAVLANASILAWWAGYWKLLLPRTDGAVPYRRMLEIVSTASSVMNTVPFGAGHATGVVLLVKRGGASQSGALSVLALDQLGEGIAKIAICLLAGELLPLPDWMHAAVRAIAVAVALLLTVMIVLAPR